jgi:hypothetical protein
MCFSSFSSSCSSFSSRLSPALTPVVALVMLLLVVKFTKDTAVPDVYVELYKIYYPKNK